MTAITLAIDVFLDLLEIGMLLVAPLFIASMLTRPRSSYRGD